MKITFLVTYINDQIQIFLTFFSSSIILNHLAQVKKAVCLYAGIEPTLAFASLIMSQVPLPFG